MWANSKDAETQKKHLTQQPHVKNQRPLEGIHDRQARVAIAVMRTGAAVSAAVPSSATGGRGSNDALREGVLPQLLPDILSGRTSRRLHCAQRLGAMPRKRQSIGSELPASISGEPRGRSAFSQPHACKAKNGFSYVTYSRLESSIASNHALLARPRPRWREEFRPTDRSPYSGISLTMRHKVFRHRLFL